MTVAMLGAVRRLRAADYALLLESVAVALVVELALRLLPFSRVLARVNGRSPNSDPAPVALRARLAWSASSAYRVLPIPATCLRESLVLCALLGRRGHGARLCLGVRKDGEALAAHAWVEAPGLISEVDRARFEAFG